MAVKDAGIATTRGRKKARRALIISLLVWAACLPGDAAFAVTSDGSIEQGQESERAQESEWAQESEQGHGESAIPLPPVADNLPVVADNLPVATNPPAAAELPAEPVEFADAALRRCVAGALGRDVDGDITANDVATLRSLSCASNGISDITPLQYALNLTSLDLSANAITDISAIKGLVNLSDLNLERNQISDFSALNDLMALSHVVIGWQTPGGTLLTSRWVLAGRTWYYLADQGEMATGWIKISDVWFYLKDTGVMQTGWLQLGTSRYFLRSNGAMATGWVADGGSWYFLSSSGAMHTGWLVNGNFWYFLRSDGVMHTGWLNIGRTWYYLQPNGVMAKGWIRNADSWFYLKSDGSMATTWLQLGKTWYYLRTNGAMATGWLAVGNNWFYMRSDGAMQTGWIQPNPGIWYYLNASGVMVTGRQTISGRSYVFDQSGVWQNEQIPLFVYGTLRTGQMGERVVRDDVVNKSVAQLPGYDLWISRSPAGGGPWPWIVPGSGSTTGEILYFNPQRAAQALARADSWEGYTPGGNVNAMNYSREVVMSNQGYVYAYVATPNRQAFIRSHGTRVASGDYARY